MKVIIPILMLLALLAGCSSKAQRLHKKDEATVAPRRFGDTYTFKIRPAAADTYEVRLAGVTETSCHLGPDFTVQYFTFAESGSLALYYGGHPQDETDRPTGRFRSSFGDKSAQWSFLKRTADFRATAYVTEPEQEDRPGYTWHLIVIADTEKEIHAIIDQLSTFHKIAGASYPKQGS
ncbi:MAG: hypothetical protein JWR15_4372 [Prosthecobacter sp.]|nr:hypothetical protein [Prosthecobacter sp.]